jgi:hypothetical protein
MTRATLSGFFQSSPPRNRAVQSEGAHDVIGVPKLSILTILEDGATLYF